VEASRAHRARHVRGDQGRPEERELDLSAVGVAGDHEVDPRAGRRGDRGVGAVSHHQAHVLLTRVLGQPPDHPPRAGTVPHQAAPGHGDRASPDAGADDLVGEHPHARPAGHPGHVVEIVGVALHEEHPGGGREAPEQRAKLRLLARERLTLKEVAGEDDDVGPSPHHLLDRRPLVGADVVGLDVGQHPDPDRRSRPTTVRQRDARPLDP